jgi:hypothetical protein
LPATRLRLLLRAASKAAAISTTILPVYLKRLNPTLLGKAIDHPPPSLEVRSDLFERQDFDFCIGHLVAFGGSL